MPTRQTKPRKAGRTTQRRPASDASTKRLAWVLSIIVAVVVTYLITSAKQTSAQQIEIADNLEAVVTNPSLPEKLINYTGMTVSFNAKTHQPNWVSWELLASEVSGDSERESQFTTDPNVDGCATTADYRNSGYDRGHMAPAGDMKWSPEAMKESFYLTNISPQADDLNRGAWKKLEEKCRQRAEVDSALVIVCGPIFNDGEAVERIGETGVAVPRSYFKVILSPYTNPPTAIGFIMPNGYVKGGMQACAVSVDSVEAVTGHDFFSALPDDIENKIEAECNFSRWSQIRRKH
jgi:endonuclease G